jgi:hypothetical protein
MPNDPFDLYAHVVEDDLGAEYFRLVIHLVELRLLVDWLVTQSCFFVILPLPDNEFEIIVHREVKHLLLREHNVQLGLIKEAVENGD